MDNLLMKVFEHDPRRILLSDIEMPDEDMLNAEENERAAQWDWEEE